MTKFRWMMKSCGVFLLWATAAVALPAQTFTTLYSFNGTDGEYPAGLVQGTDGSFFGTTQYGGANNECTYGCGTVFKITPRGTLTMLLSFDGTDGELPSAALVLATNGDFYGSTFYGGSPGSGTVYKITPIGTLTTLSSFDGTDGVGPGGTLVLGTDGNLYGTTAYGGSVDCGLDGGCGTVFRITPNGTLTTLHDFGGKDDGEAPYGGLVQGTNGDLYGTTEFGGADESCVNGEFKGCGTVFKISPNGKLTTLLSFDVADGQYPSGGLVQGPEGNLYGTTVEGGDGGNCPFGNEGCGTVFRITPTGALTTLYNFCSLTNCADGYVPRSAPIQGTDGNLYGTTSAGGVNGTNAGTAYRITTSGVLTTLYSFCSQSNCTDGAAPEGELIQGTNGDFYGTTFLGGPMNDNCSLSSCGTIFSLSVGLKPFVETQPTSGAVGAAVNILGTNLTSATSVTFNGTAAVFTVDSHSLITTTVPVGASTGKVQVSGPNGTGLSNVPFVVLP
jgi:uncharacterized repeat protein (TIGR03803 family)